MLIPALLLALATVSLADSANRVIDFAGGRTFVDSLGEVDHVLVQDLRGNVIADTVCEVGRFSDYLVLFIRFRDAVVGGDPEAAVRLVDYPFRVNASKPLTFKTAAALSKSYDKVFTPEIQQKLRDAQPAALFCKKDLATLGGGVVWAKPSGIAILDMTASGRDSAHAIPPPNRDLTLVGLVTAMKPGAAEPSKQSLVTVKVQELVSGEFSGETFQFAVRGPARTALKEGKSYTIEAVWTGDGYLVDHVRRVKRKPNHDPAVTP